MAKSDKHLNKLRKICLALPEAKETITWGEPHFRVADKIFAGYGEQDGKKTTGFKLEKQHAAAMIKDPRFWPAPYVGRHGWVSTVLDEETDWDELRELILESYRLIAPKRTLARMTDGRSSRDSHR